MPSRNLPFRATLRRTLVALVAGLALASCESSSSPNTGATVVMLDVTLALTAEHHCDTGGMDASFSGTAGTTVTILAAGASNQTPEFTLYAPDFSTQLGGSSRIAAGRARLVATLAESGTHHVTVCERTGVAGSVKVTVTRPGLTG